MTTTHVIALAIIPYASAAAAAAAILSRRARDTLFFLMVCLAVLAERMDVNFFSEAWYRGTTRGVQVSLVEILAFGLLAGCAVSRREGEGWSWPRSLGLMLLYLFYACLSVIGSEPKLYGAFELSKIAGSILVFVASAAYLRSRREWTILLVALACAVGFEGLWALKQHFITRIDRAAGTLDHANSLSMYFCLGAPPLVAAACAGWSRPLRWFCGAASFLAAAGVLLTFSRAGIPIFAAIVAGTIACCISWRLTVGRAVLRVAVTAALAAMLAASWGHMMKRYDSASLEEEYFDPHVDGRGIYLRLARSIAADHFFGVGLNNWSYYVSKTYGPRLGFDFVDYDYLESVYGHADDVYANSYLAAPAHNLAALTLGELGVPGLLIFTLLWIRWLAMGASFIGDKRSEPRRMFGVGLFFGVVGIFGQSLTEWVYRQAPILLTFYILLGALASVAAERARSRRHARSLAAAPRPDPVAAGLPAPREA